MRGLAEVLLHVVDEVGVVFAPPVPLEQSVHLALLAGQPVVVQLVQVFVGVQAEGGQAALQAEALHVVSQDEVKLLQLALGHGLQVVPVPRVVLQLLRGHAVVWMVKERWGLGGQQGQINYKGEPYLPPVASEYQSSVLLVLTPYNLMLHSPVPV